MKKSSKSKRVFGEMASIFITIPSNWLRETTDLLRALVRFYSDFIKKMSNQLVSYLYLNSQLVTYLKQ